jgi:hypothetical protein
MVMVIKSLDEFETALEEAASKGQLVWTYTLRYAFFHINNMNSLGCSILLAIFSDILGEHPILRLYVPRAYTHVSRLQGERMQRLHVLILTMMPHVVPIWQY